MAKAIYFLTGSSGSGKTTLLKEVINQLPSNVISYHFDNESSLNLKDWFTRATSSEADLVILDGSIKPSDVNQVAKNSTLSHLKIILIDCAHEERRRRLLEERNQPELDTLDIYAWAAYLRGQADVLELEIIDTTASTIDESKSELIESINGLLNKINFRHKSPPTLHN